MSTMRLNIICFFATIITLSFLCTAGSYAQTNKRYFGLHFDFHATMDDKDIGKGVNETQIEQLLSIIKPDYVQVDTKGVYGISSYPTDVGFVAGPYVKDVLRIWRRLTNEYNVDLYSHYTTIMDVRAVKEHPDWGRIDNSGNVDANKISIFSDYDNDYFLPQMKEIISRYNVDGIWIDADGWALEPEYGDNVKQKLRSKTGLNNIPGTDDESNYDKYIEFMRSSYVDYAKNYINRIHSYDPDFKIGINWAYSKMMPEPITIDVDYLSADMSGKNWVYDAAYDARVFASYDKPWDLMSWSFSDKGTKPQNLLLLEAAEVISMGGGYQSYWFQQRNGGINLNNISLMKNLSDFCREREEYCFESEIIPQVGVFFSRETWAENTNTVYNGGGNDNIQGIVSLFLDAGASTSIIMQHQLNELYKFPMVVIPEASVMSPEIKNKLIDYAKNGGILLVIGKDASFNFKGELGVDFIEPFVYKKYSLQQGGNFKELDLPFYKVKARSGTEVIINSYVPGNNSGVYSPFVTRRNFGRGVIAGLYSDIGQSYFMNDESILRQSISFILNEIFQNRVVYIDSDRKIHTVLAQKNGNIMINLINVGELKPFKDANYYANVTPVSNVKVIYKSDIKPVKIIQQPEGIEIPFDYEGTNALISVPNVNVHSILQVIN